MCFYTQPHQCYGGLDVHARSLYVCILTPDGDIVGHRTMQAKPDALLQIVAPSREDLVVAVEGLFTGDLAGRPLCPGGDSLRPGPRALHAGHPWG